MGCGEFGFEAVNVAAALSDERWVQVPDGFGRLHVLLGSIDERQQQMAAQLGRTSFDLASKGVDSKAEVCSAPQVFVAMSQQRKVHHVFDQMPHQVSKLDSSDNEQGEMSVEVVWDEKAQDAQGMLVHDNLLKQLSLGTDNSVGEDWVSDKQKQVPIHDSVIWDDESIHNIDSHVGLLQQLAQSSCEWEPTTRLFINGLPAHTNDAFLLSEVSKKSADEMCSDLTHETVLWNEERKLVEDNKVVWDDELLENDESQDKLSVLEVDEEAPCGENAKLTEAGVDLQLSPSSQEAIRKLEVGMYVAEQAAEASHLRKIRACGVCCQAEGEEASTLRPSSSPTQCDIAYPEERIFSSYPFRPRSVEFDRV